MTTAEPFTHALLTDGATVRIRRAVPGDAERVLAFYDAMSPENRRLRFFSTGRRPAELAAARVAAAPKDDYEALLAEAGDRVLGIADYAREPGTTAADISLAVADDQHHRGLGTLLLEHLVATARDAGITTFTADALSANHAVLKVFTDPGLRTRRHFDGPEVRYAIDLTQTDAYLSATDRRGLVADVASLRPLLRPRSVVVVGAGRRAGSVGRAVLRNARFGGFAGLLRAVNPHADIIEWVASHPSVASLPYVPDLAVLALPAPAVPQMAEECGEAGVRALLVLSSGLTREQAADLLAHCRRYGMRMVGPNCLGLLNTEPDVRLNATFAARPPLPGTAGVAVQSGGVGIAVLDGLSRLGIGVSTFVSLGDKYDVSGNDLLRWWETDGRTDLAVLHLESFGNPRAFSRTARRVARTMPVLTVDAGRSDAGRRAAASHTAASASPTMTRGALFTQAGVIATRTIGELLDTAALLTSQPLPEGGRVAVVTNAGGAGVLAADACDEAGLTVPVLSEATTAQLLADLPRGASAANPVDTTAAVGEEQLRRCADRLSRCGEVDTVLVVLVPTAVATAVGDDLVGALVHRPSPLPRPVAAVLPSQSTRVELLPVHEGGHVPAFGDAQDAARALAHAVTRARWLARPLGAVPALTDVNGAAAREVVVRHLAEQPDGGWLDPTTAAELLSHYAFPLSPWAWAADETEAVRVAERLAGADGAVVMKAYWPGLVHKSGLGAVVLDLRGPAQVRSAYRELARRFGDRMTGVVVQPLAGRGTELFAGVVQDAVFGPLVLFGLGGTATEVLADHAARLAPLTDVDVRELMRAPHCAPLVFGHRGGGPVDVAGLEQVLLRLSRMACDLPELAEMDFNPVLARAESVMVVDARVRLRSAHAVDPYLRRLR
ncbi:GNAT family N-acetyltransferase [Streptomyces sp. WAC05374]|uniref:bifunctional acetate--CoA ligase family protein/GNAT family N-acetyltransferase n=1 Tax=Streptomyces sp. WAC05374 TaxID=2487420 RepID=UPI000F88FD1A|nr:bifunctional GNAT family N-acetyltransferase/acetate--CoA ligase family protein [Streptomyces sp. WAC05374]RST17659.1 GNAT family N-acetyltransferase [Streptomyces sp. WAC05374]TDF54766.1 GNAT family N-acetyltransferase [Streptomyces sp. WAC05374]TDF56402.1 GNAT family N-acetyltransferase [Streptomyces sp. WAC05374]